MQEIIGPQPGYKQLGGEATKYTIQSDVRADVGASAYGTSMLLYMAQQNDLIAPWWSWRRDEDLLRIVGECDVLNGALYAYTAKMAALPFRIEPVDPSVKSHWRQAEQYQMLLYEGSDFFAGWEEFFVRWLLARNCQDNGAFAEIIGAGPADKEIRGPAVGISILDSAKCTRTGNPEYPVVYTDVDGKAYKLHYSRVMYSSQLPSIRKEMYKVGFCAASRCLAFAQTVIDDLLYHSEKLGSRPPRAILTGSRIGLDSIKTAFESAQNLATSQGRRRFGSIATVANPHGDVGLNLVSLSNLPDGFDFVTDLTQTMYAIALALGIPPRWIWPASQTGATKADAMYMHLAGSQTGPAFELRVIRNLLGGADTTAVGLAAMRPKRFLPPELKMVFDLQDDEQDLQAAQIAAVRSQARGADLAGGVVSTRVAREQMLENGELTAEQFEDLELADGRTKDGSDVKDLPYTDNEYVQGVTAQTGKDELEVKLDAARRGYATATAAARKSAAHAAIACLSAYLKAAQPTPPPIPPQAAVPPTANIAGDDEETPEQAAPVEGETPGEEAEKQLERVEPAGRPLKRQGPGKVKISQADIDRAIRKWNQRMPAQAQGILRAKEATPEQAAQAAADLGE